MNCRDFNSGFFIGINYWASKNAINMWRDFDSAVVERDFELLQNAGITHLRVFPLWSVFQPLTALYGPSVNAFEYGFGEAPLPDTEAGRAGVDETACQKFEVFCNIAQKFGFKLIVALITGHMSFRTYCPPAFGGRELLSDPEVMKWQVRFVKYFVKRFKNEPSIIAWDLGNEPANMPGSRNNPDVFYVWSTLIADAVKSCDSNHPVMSGLDNSDIERSPSNFKNISEMCDIHTTHPYQIFQTPCAPLCNIVPIMDLPFRCRVGEDIAGIPTFIQEFGSIGYMNCSKKSEADFYRVALWTSLVHNCHGVMWWCAFDQGHLNYAPYRWNTIGSDYGFFTKDLTPKPIVGENLKFRKIMEALLPDVLPPHRIQAYVIIPRDDGSMNWDTLRATYILAAQANINVGFCYAVDPIPKADLYIFPSIEGNKSIPKKRLDELLQYVKEGAALYYSADVGLLRQFPEITGVEVEWRERTDGVRTLLIDGDIYPIKTTYDYKIEQYTARAIAFDSKEEPIFFCNDYGQGHVYLLTLPLEKFVAEQSGAAFSQNKPQYYKIYGLLAKLEGIKRIAKVENEPLVCLTEHPIDENSCYVSIINYSNDTVSATFDFERGYTVESVYGTELSNGKFRLGAFDGMIVKLIKV